MLGRVGVAGFVATLIACVMLLVASGNGGAAADASAPTLTLPASASTNATSSHGAVVSFIAVGADDVQPTSLVCALPSGTTFPVGATTVTCMASDAVAHVTTASFVITVLGAADQLARLRAIVAALAIDPSVRQSLLDKLDAAKGTIATGQPKPACNQLNAFANQVRSQTGKAIQDNTDLLKRQNEIEAALDCVASTAPPVLLGPRADITTNTAPGLPSATILFTGASSGVTCAPSSPAVLPIERTKVTCTATSATGTTITSFFVNVVDAEPPVLTLPHDMTVTAPPGSSTAFVTYVATAADNSGSATVACAPASGTAFAWGTTTVSCVATDPSGNTATGAFHVSVNFAISGRITDRGSGMPLAGVGVGVSQSTARIPVATGSSGADGLYTIVVPPGTYRVIFNANVAVPYVSEWWSRSPNFDFAGVITVGGSVGGIDGALQPGYFVHGHVTDEVTHLGIAQANAATWDATQPCCRQVTPGVGTDANGNYRLVVPKGSTVKIQFNAAPLHYTSKWWNNRLDFGTADALTVNAETFNINAALTPAALVQGTVTNDQTHLGISGIGVAVSECCPFVTVAFASTGPDGHYSVLAPKGTPLQFHFFPFGGTNTEYVGEWFDDQLDFGHATNLTFTADASGIDAGLSRGITVRGHVTRSEGGAPIQGIVVDAYDGLVPCCVFNFGTRTDGNGDYALLVRAGVYRLHFFADPSNPPPDGNTYLDRWWHDKNSFELADPLVVAANLSGVDQALALSASISGHVGDATGAIPVAGFQVNAIDASVPCCRFIGGAQTDAQGNYRIEVPPGSSVKVAFGIFSGPPPGTRYLGQWWNNKGSFVGADPIAAIGSISGIDARLANGLLVSGRVTAQGTGAALPGVHIQIVDPAVPCCPFREIANTQTDGGGNYAAAVPAGTYKVQFFEYPPASPPHLGQWWNGKSSSSFEAADLLVVAADRPGVDAVLSRGVAIRGTVTDAVDGHAVSGVQVNVLDASAACCIFFGGGQTDGSGNYSAVVPIGDPVKVAFAVYGSAPPGTRYLGQWWNNKSSFDLATSVPTAVDVSGIDAHLARGLLISGHVSERGTGVALAGVHVQVIDPAVPCCPFQVTTNAQTDAAGNYSAAVGPGTYKVQFSEDQQLAHAHLPQWWNDKPDDFAADLLTVAADRPGIDAALDPGVSIGGHVSGPAGEPVVGIGVGAQDANRSCCQGLGGAQTDSLGNYRLTVLQGSRVKLQFQYFGPPPAGTRYVEQWWNNKLTFDTADVLAVNGDLAGIDAHLATGFFVRGHVSDRDSGVALAGIHVQPVDASTPCCPQPAVGFGTNTDASGDYTLLLAAGSYELNFNEYPPGNPPHIFQWWHDKPFDFSADVLVVTGDVSGIDETLPLAVFIRGRVTDATGTVPVVGMQVSAQDGTQPCCQFLGGAQTDATGNYSILVMKGSTAKVEFGVFGGPPPGTRYFGQWWNNKGGFDAADPILATADVSNIDAHLLTGFILSGHVSERGSGIPLVGIGVQAFDFGVPCCPFRQVGFTQTNGAGDYTLIVPAGTYKIQFSDFSPVPRHVSQWWRDQPTDFSAFPVVVAADTPAIDETLPLGVHIRGQVTDATTGFGIGGVNVSAEYGGTGFCCTFVGGAQTDPGGYYTLLVPSGDPVKVEFGVFGPPPGTRYVGQWWNNKANVGAADPIATLADTSNIDARLVSGFFISGHVTDSVSGAGLAGVQINAQDGTVPCCVDLYFTSTSPTGDYHVLVAPGSYRIMFLRGDYLTQWWNHQDAPGLATIIVVAGDVNGIDAALHH